MKKLSSILFSALFLTAIACPLVIMQFSELQTVSYTEKRKLAEKPPLPTSLTAVTEFPEKYETFFNDHFGLRNQLVQLYNSFFVATFQTSPKSHTVVGKDKWLFLAADFIIHDYMGLYQFDYNRLQHWKQILLDRREWLDDQGIRYLFIAPPNKVMVYPEYLPARIRSRAGRTNLDQLMEHLDTPPRYTDILDLREPLLAAKQSAQLYYKGDTHWNYDGAYVAYTEIMARLGRWFDDMEPVPKSEMVREQSDFSGDLTYTLNLARMYREKNFILRWPKAQQIIDFKRIEGYPQPPTPYQQFRRGKIYVNENPAKRITAVFISDSFGTALRDYLAPHFKKMIYVRDARFEDMKRLIEIEHPDVVLDLNVARGLSVAMGENIEIRDYILQKNMARRTMILDVTPDTLVEKLQTSANVSIGTEHQGRLETDSQDPQLYFHLPQRTSDGVLNIHCQINSSADTYLKLYFQTKDHPYYSEKKKVFYKLRKGPNSIYMRIYEPIRLDKLRLDPAEIPGIYELKRFTITVDPGSTAASKVARSGNNPG